MRFRTETQPCQSVLTLLGCRFKHKGRDLLTQTLEFNCGGDVWLSGVKSWERVIYSCLSENTSSSALITLFTSVTLLKLSVFSKVWVPGQERAVSDDHMTQMANRLSESKTTGVVIQTRLENSDLKGGIWLTDKERQHNNTSSRGPAPADDIIITHQSLSGQHLQQLDEHPSVSQVHVQIRDPTRHARQVWVHPFGEGLLLHRLSLICRRTTGHLELWIMWHVITGFTRVKCCY